MKIKFLPKLIIGVIVFTIYSTNLHAQTNESEPNNTRAQANAVVLNGTISGEINPVGDVDMYKITTTKDGLLHLVFQTYSNRAAAILYDNDGTTQLANTSTYDGDSGVITTDGLAAGTYYVAIFAYSSNDMLSYSFTNVFTPALVANDAEPNNTKAQALKLSVNSTKTGHVGYYFNNRRDTSDWYKVTTAEDGLLQIKITSNNNARTEATLYDNDGITQLGNADTYYAGATYLNTDGLAAGTYYIRIHQYTDNTFSAYTLTDSLLLPAPANDVEPNDSKAQALTLPVNGKVTGHIGYYYKNHRDTADWYMLKTTADGLLQIKLTSDNNDRTEATLYDNDGITQLGNADTYNTGPTYLNVDGLAAGTYYIRIHQYSSNTFSPYKLSDSLYKPTQVNDAEPNNNKAQAIILPLNTTVTGHAGYYYNNHRDTTDWYKITTNTVGLLQLKLTTNNGNRVSADLFDNTGTTQIGHTDTYDGTDYLNKDGLPIGTYYVRIEMYSNNSFAPYTLTDSSQDALPVTFISFNGKLQNDVAVLSWSTATEINNKGYEVQRSNDGEIFTDIDFVNGHGNSSQINNYTYTDEKMYSGSNYYRLKQIDNDEKFSYSSVIKIDYSKFDWSILGNPSNNMWLQLQLDKQAHVTVQVISLAGKTIQITDKGNLNAGTYSIPLNLNNAPSGMYVVKLFAGDKSYSKKILK